MKIEIVVQKLFCIAITLFVIFSGSCTGKLYRHDNNNRNYIGQLSDKDYKILKSLLKPFAKSPLKDTIIVKYDYNNELCWDLLDKKDDDYVMRFVTIYQARVQKLLLERPSISILRFCEPGKNLNKIIKLDKSIMIDADKTLFNLIFKERCTCGNSIIILPNKTFVFTRSDSHFEALDYTREKIGELLSKS